jgi:hypothetical protein
LVKLLQLGLQPQLKKGCPTPSVVEKGCQGRRFGRVRCAVRRASTASSSTIRAISRTSSSAAGALAAMCVCVCVYSQDATIGKPREPKDTCCIEF